jgi:outer membrane protein assembly factor BamB
MVAGAERQRTGRALVWLLAGLVAALGLFLVYRHFWAEHFTSDPERMARLRDAALPDPAAGPVADGAWPQWLGPHRDGVSTETDWRADWPAQGPPVLWRNDAPGRYSSVAVVGGRLYTMLGDGSEEAVVCWDAGTGKERWRFHYPARFGQGPRTFNSGYQTTPRSTPAVAGGAVYAVGATGLFHCLDAKTGKKRWAVDLLEEFGARPPQWGVSFSPLVSGDRVFTIPGGPDGNALAAFERRTGRLRWKALDDRAAYSSPVLMTAGGADQVLFFTEAGLVSVNPQSGALYWRYPWETRYGCNIAAPVVAGNYVFISSGYGRGCALLEVSQGAGGKPEVHRVYEGNQMCNHYSTSVRYEDHLYGFNESRLECMNFRTGKVVWKQSGYGKGSLLVADGYLIVLGEEGKLAVGKASQKGFRPQASFQATRAKCWTMPVLAEGRLYVRDEERITCLDVRKRRVAATR